MAINLRLGYDFPKLGALKAGAIAGENSLAANANAFPHTGRIFLLHNADFEIRDLAGFRTCLPTPWEEQ